MKAISSKDNPTFKQVLRVAQGKKVGSPPYVWLEGLNLSRAWLDAGYSVEYALFDESRLAADSALQAVAARLDPQQCLLLSGGLMRQLSQVEQGQGIGLLVTAPSSSDQWNITQSCVYLDRVQDPGNVGTLLRTMAAAGIEQAYLSPGCAWVWSQKVLRSAQGAHFAMRLHEGVTIECFLERLAIPLYATALEHARSLYEVDLAPQAAWVFGNEGQGVAEALLQAADQRVFIPQVPTVESLNVAAAAAICVFEHRRQRLTQVSD